MKHSPNQDNNKKKSGETKTQETVYRKGRRRGNTKHESMFSQKPMEQLRRNKQPSGKNK